MYYNKLGQPRQLQLVQVGVFLNTLGWGAVLPFEIVYLHDGRGFALGTAGLVVGALTGLAVVAAPVSGPLIDRFGARAVLACAGVALATGYAGLAFAATPAAAFAAAVVGGVGNGALLPAQTALLTALAPPALRHRATAVSRVCTNAGFGVGGAVGGLVAAHGLHGLMTLFLLNAATYLAYVAVALAGVRPDGRPEPIAGGYAVVLRDGAFVRLALANAGIIAVGWGVLPWVVPTFATHELGIDARAIGALMLANAVTVVVAQVPVARLAEGRRRVVLMATGAAIFAAACMLALVAQSLGAAAFPTLVVGAVAIGAGECCHSAALAPLVAELAPPALRGRYMAALGLSWWVGLALAPTIGTQLLRVAPAAAFGAAAAAAATAGVAIVRLERRLPPAARSTPRPLAAAEAPS